MNQSDTGLVWRAGPRREIVIAAFVLFSIVYGLCWVGLYDNGPWSLAITAGFLFASLAYATNRSMHFARAREALVNREGAVKISFGVYIALILIPALLLIFSNFEYAGEDYALIFIALKWVMLVVFLWILWRALRQISVTSGDSPFECLPVVSSYLSLTLFLGGAGRFGFLVDLIPGRFLTLNERLRLAAFVVIGGTLAAMFAMAFAGRVEAGDLDLPKLGADAVDGPTEPEAGLGIGEQIAKAWSDVEVVAVGAIRYFTGIVEQLVRVAGAVFLEIWRSIVQRERLALGAALAVQLTATLTAISAGAAVPGLLLHSNPRPWTFLIQLLYFLGFWGWLVLSILTASVASITNSARLTSYGVVTTVGFGLLGMWVFSVVAHGLVSSGVMKVPGYRLQPDHVLLISGALILLLAIGRQQPVENRIRRLLVVLGLLVGLATWAGAWWVSRASETALADGNSRSTTSLTDPSAADNAEIPPAVEPAGPVPHGP